MRLFDRIGGLESWRGQLIMFTMFYIVGLVSILIFVTLAGFAVEPLLLLFALVPAILFLIAFEAVYLIFWIADRIP